MSYGYRVAKTVQTGTANTELSVTVTPDRIRRVSHVLCAYSGTPTQAGVQVAFDSADGAAYDTVVAEGDANARYTAWFGEGMILAPGDGLRVVAPAGGAGVTASITVVLVEV